jgi:hypothetical protein
MGLFVEAKVESLAEELKKSTRRINLDEYLYGEVEHVYLEVSFIKALDLPANAKMFRFKNYSALLTHAEDTGYQLSITCDNKYPTLDVIAYACRKILPLGVRVALVVPENTNEKPYTAHLFEVLASREPEQVVPGKKRKKK